MIVSISVWQICGEVRASEVERGAGRRSRPPVEQRGGAGGHGAAAVVQPARRVLPRHLQLGRGDQPQAENSSARL